MPRRKKGTGGSGKLGINKGKPQQRNAANARERARMRVLSRAFCRLKTTLPWVPADTKLSKLDTLRLAASYIAHLKGILSDEPLGSSDESGSHPAMSLTWPFGFNRPTTLLGGNGSSVGGESEADESIDGSTLEGCWEPESPTKDCVHLDNTGQNDFLHSKSVHQQPHPHHHQMQQHDQETSMKGQNNGLGNLSNVSDSNNHDNNNIIPYNFHQNHHHPQQSNMNYGFQNIQNDIILSMS